MIKIYILIFLSIASFSVFGQYHIPIDSLVNQFRQSGNGQHIFVRGNDVKNIQCFDKNGTQLLLPVTNRTGIRIIKTDNSKETFYLNTITLTDSTITGDKTHFFSSHIRPIKFADISIIEILK
jgi:hypothetical protein